MRAESPMLDICKHLIWCSRKRLAGCIKEKQGENAEGASGRQGGKSNPSQRSQPHLGGRGQKGYPLAPAQSRLKFRGLKEREV